jgi:hypothetical protein
MLTKLQALKECKTLWMWLEKHPSCDKDEWPGWKKLGVYYTSWCPCCQYTRSIKNGCKVCPLNGFAWENESCLQSKSFYREWSNADDTATQVIAAHKMVLACRRALYAEGIK